MAVDYNKFSILAFKKENIMNHATATRTAIANAVKDLIDAGAGAGILRLRAGTDAVASVTLGDPCGTVTDGVLTFSGFPRYDLSSVGGTVDNAQVLDSDATVVLTLTAGTGAEDVVLDNATIAAGAPVKINLATYTAPV